MHMGHRVPGGLRGVLGWLLVVGLALLPRAALANFHLWEIVEIYSNADGSVLYVELFTTSAGQNVLSDHDITATSVVEGESTSVTFTFDDGAPSSETANTSLLLATATLNSLADAPLADFILPAGFFDPAATSITIDFPGADSVTFDDPFPRDGVSSVHFDTGGTPTVDTADPENFAGDTCDLHCPPSGACTDTTGFCGECTSPTQCDDGDVCTTDSCDDGEGTCFALPIEGCQATCGDSSITAPETCDDANSDAGDGCSDTCTVEEGWTCSEVGGEGCGPTLGDGLVVGDEACDDGNETADDGCTAGAVDEGFVCDESEPSVCTAEGGEDVGGDETTGDEPVADVGTPDTGTPDAGGSDAGGDTGTPDAGGGGSTTEEDEGCCSTVPSSGPGTGTVLLAGLVLAIVSRRKL